MAKTKLPERFDGTFSGIPHVVLDSIAFKGASDKAKALVFAMIRQINGRNNGHLHFAAQWLKKQGYTSSNNYVARDELIARGLVTQTRFGGLNMGANLYAVTWLPISNFVGLDIDETGFHRGEWALCKLPPTPRRPKPTNRNQDKLYDDRICATTTTVAVDGSSTSTTVAESMPLIVSPTTATVNNVVNTNTSIHQHRRIVGVKGKSGIPRRPNLRVVGQ